MAATSAVAICITMLLLVQTTVGYQQLVEKQAPAPAGGKLACPDAQSICRTKCRDGCDSLSQVMCQAVCIVSPLPAVSKNCVDKFLSVCQTVCKTACETLPSS
jgi:hypothetical protein